MFNAAILRSVKPALIRRALDVGFLNACLETFTVSVLVNKSKMKCLKVVSTDCPVLSDFIL